MVSATSDWTSDTATAICPAVLAAALNLSKGDIGDADSGTGAPRLTFSGALDSAAWGVAESRAAEAAVAEAGAGAGSGEPKHGVMMAALLLSRASSIVWVEPPRLMELFARSMSRGRSCRCSRGLQRHFPH